LNDRDHPELNAALMAFYREADLYCNGINDNVAREFAVEYTRMIGQQAEGLESEVPKNSRQLFQPTRRWICSTLEEMRSRYFPVK
jgi:hypothetical protein